MLDTDQVHRMEGASPPALFVNFEHDPMAVEDPFPAPIAGHPIVDAPLRDIKARQGIVRVLLRMRSIQSH